jgi:beta-lactamase class A
VAAVVSSVIPAPAFAETDVSLQSAIDAAVAAQEGDYSVSVREIHGDPRLAEIDGDRRVEPASVIKLFYAWAALRERDAGRLDLDQPMASGESWISCIRNMISVSDNDCAAEIRVALGNDKLNSLFAAWGFTGTQILLDATGTYIGKTTTANDVTRLLVRLEGGTLLSPESTEYLHRLLLRQIWRSRIANGVPEGVVVENKPGEYWVRSGWTQSDAGIVRGTRSTYVVTIFGRNDATKQGIAAISRAVYENLHGQSITPGTFPSNQFVPIAPIAIRDQPGGNVIGQLTPEDPVTVVLSKRRWLEIKLSNNSGGWVTYSSLKLTKEYTWE